MLTDAQWALLEPLIEAVRPKGKGELQKSEIIVKRLAVLVAGMAPRLV